ncbi:trigger factor [Anthocerotibacter panamensis]|uniref:trigger factor n=1 Tax=Anthocerotibacter panamensis TaxID=2857077 RepID=UPI001C403BF1|nr:trigger factor [Anthocerotibacter panamensis]
MRVTQEKLPNSQVGLEIEIDAARGQQVYEQTVRKYMKSARIPGFRPGKAPRPIVLQFLGKQVLKAETLEKLLDETFKEAVEQAQVTVLGNYQVLDKFDALLQAFEPGQALTYKAAVDVQPEVRLREDYSALKIRHVATTFDPALVDQTLEDARERKATYEPAPERPAQIGDVAVIDFVGRTLEGAEIEGAKGTDFQLELQTDRFIPGFIDGMVGMTLHETREVGARFPEGYAKPELSGVEARFTITLKELKDKTLPELNDELAQELGEVDTLDLWREQVEKQLRAQTEDRNRDARDAALLDELLSGTTVDLPRTLIEQEFRFLAEQYTQNLTNRGINPDLLFKEENLPFLREQISQEAITRLQRTLALAEIAKREEITVSDDEVTPRLVEYVRGLKQEVEREALINLVRDELLTEKILDWLAEHSTIEEVSEEALAAEATSTPTGELEAEIVASQPTEQLDTATVDLSDKELQE